MSVELARLESIPALLAQHRRDVAQLEHAEDAAIVERRVAAIAELAKRAKVAAPIVNEATLLRAECLVRLAELVEAGQEAGELHDGHDRGSEARTRARLADLGVDKRRVAEGRALRDSGALDEARADVERKPDAVLSMTDLVRRAERALRERAVRDRRAEREAEAAEAITRDGLRVHLEATGIEAAKPREQLDAIITDPPYVGKPAPLFAALADFALDHLKPGAPLVVMAWQPILPMALDELGRIGLEYRWTIAWRYAQHANTVDHHRRVFDSWKPVLVYHRSGWNGQAPMFHDVLESAGEEKTEHVWGQNLEGFERLVRDFSQPGDVVCDPFLGGGTTAVAALTQGRHFTGFDIDEQAVAQVRESLAVTRGETP